LENLINKRIAIAAESLGIEDLKARRNPDGSITTITTDRLQEIIKQLKDNGAFKGIKNSVLINPSYFTIDSSDGRPVPRTVTVDLDAAIADLRSQGLTTAEIDARVKTIRESQGIPLPQPPVPDVMDADSVRQSPDSDITAETRPLLDTIADTTVSKNPKLAVETLEKNAEISDQNAKLIQENLQKRKLKYAIYVKLALDNVAKATAALEAERILNIDINDANETLRQAYLERVAQVKELNEAKKAREVAFIDLTDVQKRKAEVSKELRVAVELNRREVVQTLTIETRSLTTSERTHLNTVQAANLLVSALEVSLGFSGLIETDIPVTDRPGFNALFNALLMEASTMAGSAVINALAQRAATRIAMRAINTAANNAGTVAGRTAGRFVGIMSSVRVGTALANIGTALGPLAMIGGAIYGAWANGAFEEDTCTPAEET
jgi:hypothetical protein